MLDKLGERIARQRARLGWTQQELAERLAISRTAVSHFEMDLAVPSERTVVLLAGLFRCEPHELVEGTYYPPAKADRLPLVAARYTEIEKELCLLESDLRWVERLAEQAMALGLRRECCEQWYDRLVLLREQSSDPHERRLLAIASQRVLSYLDAAPPLN